MSSLVFGRGLFGEVVRCPLCRSRDVRRSRRQPPLVGFVVCWARCATCERRFLLPATAGRRIRAPLPGAVPH